MIVLSYILTAVGGMLLGAFLMRVVGKARPKPEARKSPYEGVPATDAYERYAAKVEGRDPIVGKIVPRPSRHENPFFDAFRRAHRDRDAF